jgi:hypothetical protein
VRKTRAHGHTDAPSPTSLQPPSACPSSRGKPWAYLKVLQAAYTQLQPTRFEDLFVLEEKKIL